MQPSWCASRCSTGWWMMSAEGSNAPGKALLLKQGFFCAGQQCQGGAWLGARASIWHSTQASPWSFPPGKYPG